MTYKNTNNITGWVVFAISLFVYASTAERTASFWDCGEFIAVARHLQTPHPPGAPIFSLLGRIFSLFSGEGFLGWEASTDAAFWVNMMSAVSGAFTALFLFWSVTMLARKLMKIEGEGSLGEKIAIMGAGAVAGLACTFSDSIWFSAVEAEVYAISLFFTAFVVWAMLKWETLADSPESDRWLVLIAYMVGLSIGVHLLNLVTIPALALIFYFKKYTPSFGGSILTFLVSIVILFIVLSGLPLLSDIAFAFDRFFVNVLHLPFNFGAVFFFILIVAGLAGGIYYSILKGLRTLNISFMSASFILIGFLSYAVIIIRSGQNPPIDENNPEDLPNFISYLKREQYGDRPLFNGPQFNIEAYQRKLRDAGKQGQEIARANFKKYKIKNEPLVKNVDGKDRYERLDGSYHVYYKDVKREYHPNVKSFLPRMYSSGHAGIYKDLLKGYTGANSTDRTTRKHGIKEYKRIMNGGRIGFMNNMKYMFDRQLGRMYWRYFYWNFIGRERQKQYAGSMSPTDVSNSELPELLQHPARNNFFAIPLIIGLIGLIFQFIKDWKNFTMVVMLFFFTGIAIIIYLNAPPVEPRERDYAYAGSYYAFTMWIGLAVVAFYELFQKVIKNKLASASIALIICIIAPSIMGAVGWDDHDRSKRFFSVDGAKNILNSCAENAIIFTAGDNDTFPLWYVQEVEGFRTDVRVCNLSLLNTDWYIDQMRRKAHKSEALPITFTQKQYRQGVNDYLQYSGRKISKQAYASGKYDFNADPGMSLDKFINAVKNKSMDVMVEFGNSEFYATKTVRKFTIPLNPSKIAGMDFIPEEFENSIPKQLAFDNKATTIYKKDIMMLDMINEIAKDGWKRPIYFSTTAGAPGGENFQGIRRFLQLEGLAYRLVPFAGNGGINEEIMHKNLTENFFYRGLADESVPYTDDYDRMVFGLKRQFLDLTSYYVRKGKKEKAKEILDFYHSKVSEKNFPWVNSAQKYLDLVFKVYGKDKGIETFQRLEKQNRDVLEYYALNYTTENQQQHTIEYCSISYYNASMALIGVLYENDQKDLATEVEIDMSNFCKSNASFVQWLANNSQYGIGGDINRKLTRK